MAGTVESAATLPVLDWEREFRDAGTPGNHRTENCDSVLLIHGDGDFDYWRVESISDDHAKAIVRACNAHSQLVEALEAAETHLGAMAIALRRWADESRNGGWSTHQVDANLKAATMCDAGMCKVQAALRAARGEQ